MKSAFFVAVTFLAFSANGFLNLKPLKASSYAGSSLINAPVTILANRPPIILVPPMTGTFMDAKLHDAKVPHLYCPRNTDWKRVWYPSDSQVLPGIVDCWANSFGLVYNISTDTYSSPPGVEIQINSTLAAQITGEGAYSAIAAALVKYLGYVPGSDLLTFAYDWRLGPHQFSIPGGYFDRMKTYFEQTYASNGNKSVLVVSMSMGSPWFVDFLTRYVTAEWKAQYVSTLFSLSGVFAGAPVATQNQVAFSQGWSTHTVPASIQTAVLRLARTFGSVAWMAPPAEYWNDTVFFSTTDGEHFTAAQTGDLLRAAGANTTAIMWERASAFTTLTAPNVRVYQYYGYNVSTPQSFVYGPKWTGTPNTTFVSGDGVASVDSLAVVVQNWSVQQEQDVVVRGFFNVTHAGTLFSPAVITALLTDIAAVAGGK
jgi:hypothetical protein